MARKLRIQYPGAIYHVTNRGDRREVALESGSRWEAVGVWRCCFGAVATVGRRGFKPPCSHPEATPNASTWNGFTHSMVHSGNGC